nr:MAG TPA: hypothetical protein [Caudoviricetes sp.]
METCLVTHILRSPIIAPRFQTIINSKENVTCKEIIANFLVIIIIPSYYALKGFPTLLFNAIVSCTYI